MIVITTEGILVVSGRDSSAKGIYLPEATVGIQLAEVSSPCELSQNVVHCG